jgi:predicted Zn-dependent protease
MELAARAGYDPRASATLWQKMEKAGGSGPAEFLSTHPSPGNRQDTLKLAAPDYMVLYLEAKNNANTEDIYEFKD